MKDDTTKTRLLTMLGAQQPLWKRRWVSQDDLLKQVRSREQLLGALEELIDKDQAIIRVQFTAHGRDLLLERPPKLAKATAVNLNKTSDDDCEPDDLGGEIEPKASPNNSMNRASMDPASRHSSPQAIPCKEECLVETRNDPTEVCAADLKRVLKEFGFTILEIADRVETGPRVRRFRIVPGPGVKLASLRRCAEDVARVLGCRGELLFGSLPGERYVALDIPRSDKDIVPLLPALERLPKSPGLWLAVGMTPSGDYIAVDLECLPHLIVAGATGSGKTLWLLCAVLSLALRIGPANLEIVIIDPKGLDFSALTSLPHLRGGRVITDPTEAIDLLKDLLERELPARTELLRRAGCVNMRELRQRGNDEAKNIVVVIDEFADLMTVFQKSEREDFEKDVLRLAQRARAVGIHLILATQRPTAEFITGAIKTNMPTRISFRVPERVDSFVILDRQGAESLLGEGDLLMLNDGRLQRLQGYYISQDEIVRLLTDQNTNKLGEQHHEEEPGNGQ
jgi:DNA segregation ATPase FtsK/SpoIIIE-like protein